MTTEHVIYRNDYNHVGVLCVRIGCVQLCYIYLLTSLMHLNNFH